MKGHIITQLCVLLIITVPYVYSSKITMKTHTGDWCVRVKDFKTVLVEQCSWKLKSTTGEQIREQTFDVHPEDVEEYDEEATEKVVKPSFFLIRLPRQRKHGVSSEPLCLSSISSTPMVKKCSLDKSRFRLTGAFLPSTTPTNFCRNQLDSSAYRYKVHAHDNTCLQFVGTNKGGNRSLAFSKCASAQMMKPTQLWQLCTSSGNCSLSPSDFDWTSFIRTEGYNQSERADANCSEELSTTTASTTKATFTTAGSIVPETTEEGLYVVNKTDEYTTEQPMFNTTEFPILNHNMTSAARLISPISFLKPLYCGIAPLLTILAFEIFAIAIIL